MFFCRGEVLWRESGRVGYDHLINVLNGTGKARTGGCSATRKLCSSRQAAPRGRSLRQGAYPENRLRGVPPAGSPRSGRRRQTAARRPLRDQAGGRRCGKRSGGRLGEGFGGAYGGAADRFDGGRDPCRRKKIAARGGVQGGDTQAADSGGDPCVEQGREAPADRLSKAKAASSAISELTIPAPMRELHRA